MPLTEVVFAFLLSLPALIAIDKNKIMLSLLIFIFIMAPILIGFILEDFFYAHKLQWFLWAISLLIMRFKKFL